MRFALALLLVLASPALAQTPARDSIAVTIKSWGSVVYSWKIARGGDGEQVTVTDALSDTRKETRTTFPVSEAQFDAIRAKLADAEGHAADGIKCEKEIYDLPYGEAIWKLGGVTKALTWDYGCSSTDAKKVFASLDEANAVLKKLDPATRDQPSKLKQ